MPTRAPPYQFIAIARTIARGFTEQAIGHPEGDPLTEAAVAIWRGVERRSFQVWMQLIGHGLIAYPIPSSPRPCVSAVVPFPVLRMTDCGSEVRSEVVSCGIRIKTRGSPKLDRGAGLHHIHCSGVHERLI
jgi:hypothetical protein